MPTRKNPYYRYQNADLGNIFNGIAALMFPEQQADPGAVDASRATANMAQGRANDALANYRGEQTRGERFKNDTIQAPPRSLAELFMTGGQLEDDPIQRNPGYQPPEPTDFSLTARPQPFDEGLSSIFLPSKSATDKQAEALQQMYALGMDPDKIMKAIGAQQYLGRAGGQDPQSALPFAPFAGVTSPNAGTALSPEAQNLISARDADEALTQATSTARIQGENSARVANINNAGAFERNERSIASREALAMMKLEVDENGNVKSTGKPAAIVNIPPSTIRDITKAVADRAGQLGLTLDPETRASDALVSEITRRMQDPQSEGYKNPAVAMDEVLAELEAGALAGVQTEDVTTRRWWGATKTEPTVRRTPGAAPAPAQAAPAPAAGNPLAAARDAIARGAPREAVIQRLKENGIDPKGL
jgi:hypothetical protein